MRDRTENILIECGVLIDEVVQVNLAEKGQGNVTPNESDLELEEGQAELEREVESTGLVIN